MNKLDLIRSGLFLALSLAAAQAETPWIDWSTVNGGGGTSTGGVYAVTGTIGQPDAGTMSGDGLTLSGGFWGMLGAYQTPSAPLLTVSRKTPDTIVVSWPLTAGAWILERTNTLTTVAVSWPPVAPPYQTNGNTISVSFPNSPPAGKYFFRLHAP
jgi:hypothetical protein